MDAIEAILTRRSIRRYLADDVSDDAIDQLLHAAMSAPTAANQPYHFVVVRDRNTLSAVPRFHPHAKMLETASVAIVVCGDPTIETRKGRWVLDCAAATENMLIAANAMGLGACWVGIFPVEERIKGVRSLFELPEHVIPVAMVSVGHPAVKKAPPDRFKPDRIHYERW